jgi:hypothetical protein
MKKTIVYSASLLSLLVIIQSCVKDLQGYQRTSVQPDQYLNVSVASGQKYTFTAGTSGNLTVMTQASHYQVSQASVSDNGSAVYDYTSSSGYMGDDKVVLLYAVSQGASENHTEGCSQRGSENYQSTTTISIKINVTK